MSNKENKSAPDGTSGSTKPGDESHADDPLIARPSLMGRLRAYFLAGVLVTAPAGITVYLTWMFINFVDNRVEALLPESYHPDRYIPFSLPGLGLVAVVLFLILVGALTAGFLGRILVRTSERILNRMPVVRSIYGAIKQIFETVLTQQSSAFREVVMVEYPRRGIWAVGFITGVTKGEVQNLTTQEMVNVFLPTTPNPTSGFLLFIPREDLVVLNMTVEEGIKMVISGGIVSPPDRRPKKQRRTPVIGPKPEPEVQMDSQPESQAESQPERKVLTTESRSNR